MYRRSEASEESNKGEVRETLTVWPVPGAPPGTKEVFIPCLVHEWPWVIYIVRYVCVHTACPAFIL